ncbi:hypothetical protein [Acaryochloris sp. CCMEE 5410]|uniref:hypothetical protein n=1 Tax=Acaryochloris sp. CCMEE 5410 TaxID=310037 RepID=UPI0002483EB6|nr:hypothetical protein [Acaryochloris sp. CCMEE 5410]KAI9129773.1 hypothetical protein ON05_032060 [Acaryochloris sp. CCMEE 5410]
MTIRPRLFPAFRNALVNAFQHYTSSKRYEQGTTSQPVELFHSIYRNFGVGSLLYLFTGEISEVAKSQPTAVDMSIDLMGPKELIRLLHRIADRLEFLISEEPGES